ncbi:MAG: PQQ-binding-like beta-propeller repeat protein [bacterium]
MNRRIFFLMILSGLLSFGRGSVADEIEFRLVPYDRPEVTVDSLEVNEPILNPVQTARGVEVQKVGVKVVCWARNILLDGQPLFERYHEGKYIDRIPRARQELKPGRHVLWPGDHVFTLGADGTLTSESPDLLVAGKIIRIKAYPVTIRALLSNPTDPDLPPSMREAPLPDLTLRDSLEMLPAGTADEAHEAWRKSGKAHELLPVFEKFAPLTIWLPAHHAGHGYQLHPVGISFQLGADGIAAGAGGGLAPMPAVRVSQWEIGIPLYAFPLTGDRNCSVVVTGVEKMQWGEHDAGTPKFAHLYPRRQGYEVCLGMTGSVISVGGDLSSLPVKALRVDLPDPTKGIQRGLLAELSTRHFKPGDATTVRLQAIDSGIPAGARVVTNEASATLTNRLDGAALFARLQGYAATNWVAVEVRSGPDCRAQLAIPRVPDGLYKLELGVRPADEAGPPLSVETWITVSEPRPMSLGLFTQRGRDAFYRGESFWVGAGLLAIGQPIPAGTPLQVDLVDAQGRRFSLFKDKLGSAVKDRDTRLVQLDSALTLQLAPGSYRVEATLGQISARPLVFDLVEPEPATHFDNIILGKYSSWGSRYAQCIRSGQGAEELVRELRAMGINGFKGMSYDMDRVVHNDAVVEQVIRECPELGPWEAYAQSSGRDRFLNACVRYNLRFWEDLFTYNDTTLPRGDAILGACARYAGLETHSMRHSPAFQGVCLYDEIYTRSLIDGVPIVSAFEQAMELGYRAKNPNLTSAKAMKAFDRYIARPVEQRNREDLDTFRTYPAYEDECWRLWCDRLAGSVKSVMPSSANFTLNRYWGHNGGNIAANGREEDVFASLDIAACVMYKDSGCGDRPVFAPMQADVLRLGGKGRVWTQLHTYHSPGIYDQHILRQAFFALSQRIEGFTYFTLGNSGDALKNIAGTLCTRYGDFFLSLDKGYKKVAIYYSRSAQYLGARKPNSITEQCEGLWVACLRAGYPADFLGDDDIAAGRAMEYSALFAPGFTFEDECPAKTLTELRRFSNAGKTLLVERSSHLPVEGAVRLDSELDEYDPKLGSFPKYTDFETEQVWDRSVETTRLVRETLAKHILPAARHDMMVGPDWLIRGEGQYMVVPNLNQVGFTGLSKTLYQAPLRTHLEFPRRPPVCFDLLEMKPVAVKTEGEWMSLELDMAHYPGKVLAFLPEAPVSVRLETSAELKAGQNLSYRVTVLGAKGQPINASFPLEIRITTPSGQTMQEIYRAAAPEYVAAWTVPVNGAPGAWIVSVRELVSGLAAKASVQVKDGLMPAATFDTAKVRFSDPGRLAAFLAGTQGDILIPLEPEQQWARPAAERLCKGLATRGRKASIVNCEAVARPPGPFDREQPRLDGTRLWRGDVVQPGFFIDGPVILLGRRGENRLIEALTRRDALSEPLTSNFPGQGGALVSWTHSAFANGFDSVAILANDAEGLGAGVDAFLALKPEASSGPAPVPRLQAPRPVTTGLVPGQTVAATRDSFAGLISGEDMVQSMDLDPATGRVLVGTFGYGENLFCLGPDGKLLWKIYLPEHDVYTARWYDDGRRIMALTGRGWYLFLLDGQTGRVIKKLAATEWADTHWSEGAIDTHVQAEINPALKQILVAGRAGLLALDYEGRRLWFSDRAPEIVSVVQEAEKSGGAAAFPMTRSLVNMALSPDGSRLVSSEYQLTGSTEIKKEIVDVWAFRPRFLDARTGALIVESHDDPGNQTSAGGWSVRWPAGSAIPWVDSSGLTAPLPEDGKLGRWQWLPGRRLKGDRFLKGSNELTCLDVKGRTIWSLAADPAVLVSSDVLAPDLSRLYRSLWNGDVLCIDLADGTTLWKRHLAFRAKLQPVADGVMAGAIDGTVARFGLDGQITWQAQVPALHEAPSGDYPAYVRAGLDRDPDATGEYYPAGEDKSGDLDSVLRFGMEQLANGGFEDGAGWMAGEGKPQFSEVARAGKRSLRVIPGTMVTQGVDRRVVPLGTYLLEFSYRPIGTGAVLTAGVQFGGESAPLTLSAFKGRPGVWSFGRLAVKAPLISAGLTVGLESTGGEILVDQVSLRPIRFPSANLLANPELYAVEPTFVRDIRVRYSRIPSSLKQKLISQNHVTAFKQGGTDSAMLFTEEESFLHNSRLDDIGTTWFQSPDAMGFSVALVQPAWVSHLVLYLNNAMPEEPYRTIAIEANNIEAKISSVVALVRNNRRRFVVVHFEKPIFTDVLKILPGRQLHANRDSLTEVEVYGPVGGPDTGSAKAFPVDPLSWPMFMGGPAHVPPVTPADLCGNYSEKGRLDANTPVFPAGPILAKGLFVVPSPGGGLRSASLGDELGKRRLNWGRSWTFGTITPLSTPAWYAGRLLVGSADERLHAIAENGARLWSFQTEGRVYSAPTPAGDDVFFGSDDGKLYRVDLDSGILIWEYKTAGKIRAAAALAEGRIYAASWDGQLHAVTAESGKQAWTAPIAPCTRAAAAVSGGVVFLGDESGHMRAFGAADGKSIFDLPLGGRISRGAVVSSNGIFYASDQGHAALVSPAGQVLWSVVLGSEVTGQPLATQTQLLVPTRSGLQVLRQQDGRPDERLKLPGKSAPIIGVIPSGERLFMLTGSASTQHRGGPVTYAEYDSAVIVLGPEENK